MKIKQWLYQLTGFTLFDINRNQNNAQYFGWKYWFITIGLWIMILPLSILQFIGVFVFVNWCFQFWSSRPITAFEKQEAGLVFSKSIHYNKVRVKVNSKWAIFGTQFVKGPHLGFVFLNTIHFSRTIESENNQEDMAWLIHELTHVSQYQKYGMVYIFKAFRAQRNGGYSFQKEWLSRPLKQCNFEQQADISKQYYLDLKGGDDSIIYDSIIEEIRNTRFC